MVTSLSRIALLTPRGEYPKNSSYGDLPVAEFVVEFSPHRILETFRSHLSSSSVDAEREDRIVLFYLSTCPFALGVAVAFKTCLIFKSPQYFLNTLLMKQLPRSVIILLGTPKFSIMLSKNVSSGCVLVDATAFKNTNLVKESTITIKYWFFFFDLTNGPTWSMWIVSKGVGTFSIHSSSHSRKPI